jgi:curved DNA-binding protein CbpA
MSHEDRIAAIEAYKAATLAAEQAETDRQAAEQALKDTYLKTKYDEYKRTLDGMWGTQGPYSKADLHAQFTKLDVKKAIQSGADSDTISKLAQIADDAQKAFDALYEPYMALKIPYDAAEAAYYAAEAEYNEMWKHTRLSEEKY